jgi:hypothetical protein
LSAVSVSCLACGGRSAETHGCCWWRGCRRRQDAVGRGRHAAGGGRRNGLGLGGPAAGRGAAAAAGGGGTEAGHGPLQGDLTRAAASCVRRLRYMSGPTRLVAPTPTIAAAAISQPAGSHTRALIASLHANSTWSASRLHTGGLSWVDPAGAAAPDRNTAGVLCATVGVARSGLADGGPSCLLRRRPVESC